MHLRRMLSLSAALALGGAGLPIVLAGPASGSSAICSLTTPVNQHDERVPSCVATSVALDRLPSIGETATVTIRIRSQVSVGSAKLLVRLSDTLRLDTVQGGQSTAETFALSPRGRTVSLRVTAVAMGPAQVQADVTDVAAPAQERAGHGSTVFTVGATTSVAGTSSHDVVPARGGQSFAAAAAGQICALGKFTVTDKAGATIPGRNVPVAVLGKTTSSASTVTYASGLTNATDGTYRLCFTSPVTTMYSLQVKFTSDSTVWRVTNNCGGTVYTVTTTAKSNVPDGSEQDFGTSSPTSTNMRGWHAFDALNLLWTIRSSGTNCWTARETSSCTKITIHWQPGSTDGTYFSPSGRYVALADADPDSEHLVLHEAGHAFMDLLYNRWWPPSDCPSPHYLHRRSGSSCAWTEGFANAVAGHAKGDGMFYWPTGESINLMNTTPFNPSLPVSRTNIEDGDQVECRVAGSLIDLWRQVDGGPAGTFDLMRRYQSSSFREHFNDDRPLTGLNTSATTRDLVYTHTIDYRTGTPGTIVNGGFESGATGWSITGNVVTNATTYPAHQGSWYARMGGNGVTNTDTLSQQVTVPSGVSSATVGYYLRIVTQETGSTVYDTFKVQVVSGGTTTTLTTLSNVNPSTGYVYRTVNLNNYRGLTITLKFVSSEDASLRTDFVLDDISLITS